MLTINHLRHAWAVLLVGLVTMSGAGGASAADPAAPLNPELVARVQGVNGAERARVLQLSRLNIDVDVLGQTAQTTILVTFANTTAATLEGDFTLDLPAGSVVTGYALDMNGKMIDGVLVDQRTGELAYARKVRQGLDPGLAVVTRNNAFRTHVFPIVAGSGRTIRLSFVSPFDAANPFRLPLITDQPVGAASVHVRARGFVQPPRLAGLKALPLEWAATSRDLQANGSAKGQVLSGAITLVPAPQPQVTTLARHHAGETFFELDGRLPERPSAAPDRVRIYWDRSRSRREAPTDREAALVRRFLEGAHARAVDLVLFSDGEPQVESFAGVYLAAEVEARLHKVTYAGATSFARVFQAPLRPAQACLFFSDGRWTIDEPRLARVSCPLFTISDTAGDHGFLASAAHRSGGEHLILSGDGKAALERLLFNAPRVVGVTAGDGREVEFMSAPTAAGRFRLIGRGGGAQQLTVQLSTGEQRQMAVGAAGVVDHDGLGDLWAAGRVSEMAALKPRDPDVLATARRFGVASGPVAFIVLETPRDYANNAITPPDAFGPEFAKQYRTLAAEALAEKAALKTARLETVLGAWEEQKTWWRTTFHPAPAPKSRAGVLGEPSLDGAPPPPAPPALAPPPPPAPAPAPAPSTSDRSDELVVTGARLPGSNPGAAQSEEMGGAPTDSQSSRIEISAAEWRPDRPYLRMLEAASAGGFEDAYAKAEAEFGETPAFYLDVSEYLFRRGDKARAGATVLNALELPTTNTATLVIVADRLMRYGQTDRAIWLDEKILLLEPDRPQPRRNLALALAVRAAGAPGQSPASLQVRADYRRALALLNEVIMTPWDEAWDGAWPISLMEANHLIPTARQAGVSDLSLDPRLIALLDVDLRVVLEWNTDATDMDLWVDEPSGERAIFNHPRTAIGGRLSRDLTRGYGPEEYLLHRAPAGTYTVRANTYRADQLDPNGATVVRAHLFRHWGRTDEQEQTLEIELKPGEGGSDKLIGTLKVDRPGAK
jgi:hypothetical protein